jgi:predicted nucleic acid-binding protein
VAKVVDASVMIELLSGTAVGRRSAHLLDDDLYAPDLLIPEVLNYFRKTVQRGAVSAAEGQRSIDLLASSDIEYCSVSPYISRIWEMRANLTPYDACYVALAQHLGCALLTTDARLAVAPSLGIPVIVA